YLVTNRKWRFVWIWPFRLSSSEVYVGLDFPLYFFSGRRRHTRWPRDWSSDVCSSDLWRQSAAPRRPSWKRSARLRTTWQSPSKRSEERRVGKSVDLGGRWSFKKKKKN